jgi:hypothetical protein
MAANERDPSFRSRSVSEVAERLERQAKLETEAAAATTAARAPVTNAARRMRKDQAEGRVIDGPTPERMAKANGMVRRGSHAGYVLADSQLDQLEARRVLDPDAARNLALAEAGRRFFADAYYGGLVPSRAIDPSRVRVDGVGPADALLPGERHAHCYRSYLAARAVLPDYVAFVVVAVCMLDRAPDELGPLVSGYSDRSSARAVVMDRLRAGLGLLHDHYRGGRKQRDARAEIRAWLEPGARPTIDGNRREPPP